MPQQNNNARRARLGRLKSALPAQSNTFSPMSKSSRPSSSPTLGFLGAGHMAQAIAHGVIDAELFSSKQIIASAPTNPNRAAFIALGCRATADNVEILKQADIVVIACKPQMFPQVAPQVAAHLRPGTLLISIMAGLSLAQVAQAIAPAQATLVRAMPNTPLAVGYGVTALCAAPDVSEKDFERAMELFAAAGTILPLDEAQMDAFTAVAGSGPAYLFYLAEAMEKSALDLGLPAAACRAMVIETLMGAVALLTQDDDAYADPAQLRRAVTSPRGCTAEAIRVFDEAQLPQTVSKALAANAARSRELRDEAAKGR